MEQRIFDMKLSVEGTSLYLLMVGLAEAGSVLSRDIVLRVWNAPPEQLDQAFTELVARRVAGAEPSGAWFVRPPSEWLRP